MTEQAELNRRRVKKTLRSDDVALGGERRCPQCKKIFAMRFAMSACTDHEGEKELYSERESNQALRISKR